MKYLEIPLRFLFGIIYTVFKFVVFLLGILIFFIWYFNFKFFQEWRKIMYSNFLETESVFGMRVKIYPTFSHFVNKKSITINKFKNGRTNKI